LAVLSSAQAAQPWDQAFAKDTRAIAEAAKQVNGLDNPEIVVLLEEHKYTVHSDGRIDASIRKVFLVLQQDAVDDWSTVEHEYQPWYQQKPEIRARVIAPDGSARALDPATIADSPAREFDSSIFSDTRAMHAPLPGVAAGSIVESEVVVHDIAPLLDAGVVHRVAVDPFVTTERFHVTIEAESGITLQTAARLIPESALHRETSGKVSRVECDFGPIEVSKRFESNLPADIADRPYLAFSTGKTWQSIAARYAAIVNQRLQSADWKTILDGVDLQGTPRDVALRLTARLHKQVRYTGVEFGEAAIVPGLPAETIRRGYGDCKDKATLLVAMLRAAGLKADVALLSVNYATDVDTDLPGMGMFNHAIVHVASEPPLWIDATATDTRVGFLPGGDQGRLALIANADTTGLTKTPEAGSQDNWRRHSIEIKMSEFGSGSARETIEVSGGAMEATLRSVYGQERSKAKEQIESYTKQNFAAKSLGKYEVSARDDWSGPFRMTVEALEARTASTGPDDAGVALSPWLVFDSLPYALLQGLNEPVDGDADQKERSVRKHDFVIGEPYQEELRYKIVPPALFQVTSLPASEDLKLGPATYSRSFHSNADGSIEAIYKLDTGKRRLTPEEFETLREGLKKHVSRTPELIAFAPTTAEYLAVGQVGKALALTREAVDHNPENAMAHVRLARMLLNAHLGGAAMTEAKKATELDPNSGAAWQTLGWVYQHDTFGRRMQGNWNYSESEKCYRKALELDPEDFLGRMDLAILLEHNADGWRYARDARVAEAIPLYRELLKQQPNPAVQQSLAVALLRTGQMDAAKEESKKAPAEFQALMQATFIAIQDGPAKAILNVQSAYPDPRQRATQLTGVSATLVGLRQYPPAQVLANAAARTLNIAEMQTRAELLSRLKKWEDTMLPDDDPRRPVQRLLFETLQGNLSPGVLKAIVSKRADLAAWDQSIEAIRSALSAGRRDLAAVGLDGEVLVDFIFSLLDLEKDGDETHGYRIVPHSPGTSSLPTMYVIPEDGKYRLLGLAGPLGMKALADLVLDLLSKNDLKGAQWWLDKVTHFFEVRLDGTGTQAINALWSGVTPELRGPAAIRVAAASLMGAGTGNEKAVQTLQEARLKAPTAVEKAAVDKAICESLLKASSWTALMEAAKRLEASKIYSEEGFRFYIKGASGAWKWPELESEAKARFQGNPKNSAAARAVALALARQGNWTGAAEWAHKSEDPVSAAEASLVLAWSSILAGKPDQTALVELKKATFGQSYRYTQAMLEASLLRPDEAVQTLMAAIGSRDYHRLDPAVWIAYSRICEQYGFPAEAGAALAKARNSEHEGDELSAWVRAAWDLSPGIASQQKE
jgi:tetratricopeptide (TPR) repeat protein